MSTYIPSQYLLGQVEKMIVAIDIIGNTRAQIVRELKGVKEVGIRLLRNQHGKVMVRARDHQGNAYLYSITSNTFNAKDLRFLISTSRKISDEFFPVEEFKIETPITPISFLQELRLLEKKFRADKATFPVPTCIDRLLKVRRYATYLDGHIARARGARKKARDLEIAVLMAHDRANKIAQKGLEFIRNIDSL
jgi:hypothetical protein